MAFKKNIGWIISFVLFAAYVVLMILAGCGALRFSSQKQIIELSVGERCPERIGYPASTCQLAESCTTLVAYKHLERSMTVCGFISQSGKELLCCPDPAAATSPTPTPTPTPTTEMIPVQMVTHLASLGYYKADTLDEIVYRCTAIILSPSQLLATTICVGKKTYEKPNRVLVGVKDPRKFFEPGLEFAISTKIQYKNDLALFKVFNSIDLSQPEMANVSLATLCNATELEGDPKLYAVGFAQENDSNCGLFTTRLERFNDCSKVELQRRVYGIDKSRNLCLVPQPNASHAGASNECTKCLTASTSVLHVERADGSFCVAGIATPTTNDCIVNSGPIYYTSIVGRVGEELLSGIEAGNANVSYRTSQN